MSQQTLEALVEQIRSLPAGEAALGPPRAATVAIPFTEAAPPDPRRLRARAAALVAELAARIEVALPEALMRATQAWDQADAFDIVDAELRDETATLRSAAEVLAATDDAALRAAGAETRLFIDAAVGLVALLQRRFAALVRLRLRSATPSLMVDGRPFVDVAAALSEAARRWR